MTPTCGGKLAPVCPQGCEPICYPDPPPMLSAAWECDPIDTKVTPPGACGPAGPCFANGIACGQDSYCCSGLCSEQGVPRTVGVVQQGLRLLLGHVQPQCMRRLRRPSGAR